MRAAAAKGRRAARSAAEDRKFVTALSRGLEVLRAFGAGDRHLGNQEIAQRTGLPKPTVSRLTYTLTRLGYLRQPEADGRYALGAAVLGLGLAALGQMDVRRIARPLMQALAEHTHGSVNLGIRDQLGMVYIDTYRNAASYTVQLDVGSRIPLASSSMGRAWLAAAPEPARKAVLDQLRAAEPARFPELRRGIEQALRDYEARGFCMSLGEWRREVHAVAAPVVAPDGGEILVFSCSGAPFQFGREALETDIGPRLITLVGNVRSALGAR
jgi:DNA-binding IclR family transcriptional regulator